MKYKAPLRLFWHNKEQNFGDAISQTIVSHVAQREVAWAGHHKCEMYALGYLMKMVKNNQKEPRERGGKRDRRTLDRLHLSGHRVGFCRRQRAGRRITYRERADIAVFGRGHQHRGNFCSGPALQTNSSPASHRISGRTVFRGGPSRISTRGLRPGLSAMLDRLYDGQRKLADLTHTPTIENLPRAASVRALRSCLERE